MSNPNYISALNRNDSLYNPIAQQLIFGGGGIQGLLPQAITASNRAFFNPDGTPRVYGQQVAGFNPDQRQAFQMTRDTVGMRDPLYNQAQDIFSGGLDQYTSTLGNVANIYGSARDRMGGRLDEVDNLYRGSVSGYGQRLADQLDTFGQSRDRYQRELGDIGSGLQQNFADLDTGLNQVSDIFSRGTDRYQQELGDIGQGFQQAVADYGAGLDQVSDIYSRGRDRFTGKVSGIDDIYAQSVADYGAGLDEVGDIYRDIGARRFDPADTARFFNPFEDEVVQRTITDVMDAAAEREQGQIASDIGRGGESAFGSRARLGALDRAEALGRGLGESIANIRRGGFDTAMSAAERDFGRDVDLTTAKATGLGNLYGSRFGAETGLGTNLLGTGQATLGADTAFGGQQQNLYDSRFGAERGLGQDLLGISGAGYGATRGLGQDQLGLYGQRFSGARGLGQDLLGISGLGYGAGQAFGTQQGSAYDRLFGAETGLAGNLAGTGSQRYSMDTGFGGQLAGLGQNLYGAQTGFGNQLLGLGDQRYGASQQDISNLLGIGGTQQAFNQRLLDAQTANERLGQQAYMGQLAALAPFYNTAITQAGGPSAVSTTFQPQPSALGAGLNLGLGAFGALGNYFGQMGR